jgi:thiosulfate/3-mercaptopyruvate sulfurtransferase
MLPWISAADLRSRLDEPQLRVVDVRFELGQPDAGREAYALGHVPGAVYLDLERDLSGPVGRHGGRHPLPEVADLAHALGRAGIDERVHVVVYDGSAGMVAGRLWWLLRWLGHTSVQTLDGGLDAWFEAGGSLSTNVPDVAPVVFTPRPQPHMVIDRTELLARLDDPDLAVVDARAAERFRGEVEPIDPRAGHVPGAVNLPYADNLDGTGRVKSPTELWSRYAAVARSPEIAVYCGSGVSAAHDLMALEAAGVTGARLYPGSWSDWVSHDDAPVALGPEDAG